jgi:type VI secretion system protein ImpE
MSVKELFQAGKLKEAIQALGAEIRDNPSDNSRRTFLFELLCFAGEHSRAEKHLTLLADAGPDAAVGTLVYRSALLAERKREAFFQERQHEKAAPVFQGPRPGRLNGERFYTIEDIDPRIGRRLELFIAGEYIWLPFAHIGSLTMPPPRYLRDLLWSSASITGGPALDAKDFGEVLLPVLYPFSWKHDSEAVKLGRATEWVPVEGELLEIPFGQKLLVLDGERTVSFLDIRSLEFDDSVPLASSDPVLAIENEGDEA